MVACCLGLPLGERAGAASAPSAFPAEQTAEVDLAFGLPDELQDPAFDRYVDLMLLVQALEARDPSAIADGALQLAEGERTLLRAHKAFSAAAALKLAARVAGEKKDQATLDRLTRFAQQSGRKELSEQVMALKKLSSGARSSEALLLPVEQTSPEQFAACRGLIGAVDNAIFLEDIDRLQGLEKALGESTNLTEDQRNALRRKIGLARENLPKTPSADAQALRVLLSGSRDFFTIVAEKAADEAEKLLDPSDPSSVGGTFVDTVQGKTHIPVTITNATDHDLTVALKYYSNLDRVNLHSKTIHVKAYGSVTAMNSWGRYFYYYATDGRPRGYEWRGGYPMSFVQNGKTVKKAFTQKDIGKDWRRRSSYNLRLTH